MKKKKMEKERESGLFSVVYCPRRGAPNSLINKLPMTDRKMASLHRKKRHHQADAKASGDGFHMAGASRHNLTRPRPAGGTS